MMGLPCMSAASFPPDSAYLSACSRDQSKGLGAYSPESGIAITLPARSSVPILALLLNKGTKMTAGLVIFCPGLAVAVPAPRVVAFPLQSLSCGDIRRRLNSPCVVTRAEERLILALQVFVGLDGPELGGELFKLGPALRDDHANRLVDLEPHRHQLAGEFPAHAETRACPVGFDYAL